MSSVVDDLVRAAERRRELAVAHARRASQFRRQAREMLQTAEEVQARLQRAQEGREEG